MPEDEAAIICSERLVCSSPSSRIRRRICARRTAGESCAAICQQLKLAAETNLVLGGQYQPVRYIEYTLCCASRQVSLLRTVVLNYTGQVAAAKV